MPELPEVQVVINYLKNNILNKKIIKFDVYLDKLFKNSTINEFRKKIINSRFIDIVRRGKYLLFVLDNKKCILSHLRMEGKYFYENDDYQLQKHDYVCFYFDDKTKLIYNDTRQFGVFEIYDSLELALNSKSILKLGPEPFDDDNFTFNYLKSKIKKSNTNIKTFLLDQTNIAGIGNIYANEILFQSKINPMLTTNKFTDSNILDIIKNTKEILAESIKNNGTTIHTFKFNKWSIGDYQKFLKVHMRKNEKCFDCKTQIVKIELNGRGTYYCPTCQNVKLKKKDK